MVAELFTNAVCLLSPGPTTMAASFCRVKPHVILGVLLRLLKPLEEKRGRLEKE